VRQASWRSARNSPPFVLPSAGGGKALLGQGAEGRPLLVAGWWRVARGWDLGSFLHILFAEALELQGF